MTLWWGQSLSTSLGQDHLDLLVLSGESTTGYTRIYKDLGRFHIVTRTLIYKVEPEWEKATLRFEREHVGTFEQSNDQYETCPAPWAPTLSITSSVSHHFTLETPQNVPGQFLHKNY